MEEVCTKFSKQIDLSKIFKEELEFFNPDHRQCDSSEFLNFMLDKLHEEIADINQTKVPLKANERIDSNTTQDSAVWQIFGSTLKTELKIDDKEPQLQYEPTFQIMVDIKEDECNIEDCLDTYFTEEQIESSSDKVMKQ